MFRTHLVMLWKFLGFFQDPFTRRLHALVAGLVALQALGGLMVSQFMYAQPWPQVLPLWAHATGGLVLLCLSLLLTVNSLRRKGLAHFFPYLFGDITQLRQDIRDSLHFKVVGPRTRGLASSVQGLGLGALLLTALLGATWLLAQASGSMPSFFYAQLHVDAALLLMLYFLGHGTMAMLHFTLWQKKTRAKTQ